MTPQQFRNIRLMMGMTQAGLGKVLGVTIGTVSRLENGKYAISKLHAYSMLWLQYIHTRATPHNNDHTRNDAGQYDHE